MAIAPAYVSVSPARADECGTVPCTEVTEDYTSRIVSNILKNAGSDCMQVKSVHLLDKSTDNIMMIYYVRCHDGAGVQKYQMLYWVRDHEMIIDKLTGSFANTITKKYANAIGLEER